MMVQGNVNKQLFTSRCTSVLFGAPKRTCQPMSNNLDVDHITDIQVAGPGGKKLKDDSVSNMQFLTSKQNTDKRHRQYPPGNADGTGWYGERVPLGR